MRCTQYAGIDTYTCEAYSRICECGASPHARRQLLADLEPGTTLAEDRVDAGEYLDILSEAVAARNGWKRILARCAAPTGAHPGGQRRVMLGGVPGRYGRKNATVPAVTTDQPRSWVIRAADKASPHREGL